jgi:hypothetical protein
METRVAILEHMAQATLATLERIERKFETMDRRFEMVDRHFEAMEGRIDAMNLQHRADFRWLLGVTLGGWGSVLGALGGILGVIAHGFHWF